MTMTTRRVPWSRLTKEYYLAWVLFVLLRSNDNNNNNNIDLFEYLCFNSQYIFYCILLFPMHAMKPWCHEILSEQYAVIFLNNLF